VRRCRKRRRAGERENRERREFEADITSSSPGEAGGGVEAEREIQLEYMADECAGSGFSAWARLSPLTAPPKVKLTIRIVKFATEETQAAECDVCLTAWPVRLE